MKSRNIALMILLSFFALMSNIVLAENNECLLIGSAAKNSTINGQSNIPLNSYVVANINKVLFYSAPNELCKKDGVFVILGDYLYAYKIYKDFTYVNYITVKGDSISGWVKSAEIKNYSPLGNKSKKENLNISDFIAIGKDGWVGLGGSFSNNITLSKEKEISSEYIGDFPNNSEGLNKFYSHSYTGIAVISSNVGYLKRLWNMDDDYVISTISLSSLKYMTSRGVKVGDSVKDVLKEYGGIKNTTTNGNIRYNLGEMSLSFDIDQGKVSTIEMSLTTTQE